MAGITPLDLLYAELRAGQEKTTWPHALPAAGVVSDFRRFAQADPLREPLSRHVYEEARLYWERAPDRIDAAFEEDVFWYDEPDSILLGVAERVITGDVNLMEGHRRLGAHYEHAGLLPEAFREYRTAARILPIEPDNYTGAARVLLRAEYPERAKAYLQQTLRLSPGTPDIMARMAECEFKLGRREEMQTWLDRTLAIDPGNAKALSLMRRVAGSSADSAHVPR
jgi:tetratricopeptide (TPR) repeat protein